MQIQFPTNPSDGSTYRAPTGVLYTYDLANKRWDSNITASLMGATGPQGPAGPPGGGGSIDSGSSYSFVDLDLSGYAYAQSFELGGASQSTALYGKETFQATTGFQSGSPGSSFATTNIDCSGFTKVKVSASAILQGSTRYVADERTIYFGGSNGTVVLGHDQSSRIAFPIGQAGADDAGLGPLTDSQFGISFAVSGTLLIVGVVSRDAALAYAGAIQGTIEYWRAPSV